jgi:phosphoenolpyruvate synthase/pyruvate phosphate dikinase
VWASKYNERALLSMRKVGLDFRDLRMAVLVQRVVPAAYAFVIHTHNPSTGATDEVYAEVVAGLGESIVSGLVPGSALGCVVNKADLSNPQVRSHPLAMKSHSINGEKRHALDAESHYCDVLGLGLMKLSALHVPTPAILPVRGVR